MVAERTELCIAGGGPAGMMAGLLFARAGVETLVLEKHGDFLRDFRGDTVHPSTLRLFSELGLLDRFLERPHNRIQRIGFDSATDHFEIGDLSAFDPRWNFIALMPQWEFLDFVADEARTYPKFRLQMNAEATDLIEEGGRIVGVRVEHEGRPYDVRSRLVIAADGRGSALRDLAGLERTVLGAPIDVFWFRIPKPVDKETGVAGFFRSGRIMVLLDRGTYWQCAYVFPKGAADEVRARGLTAFRDDVAHVAPILAEGVGAIAGWEDVKLLTVALDRLERWHRPGFLVIGDAAHAMSPIGGVGINVAIQDAVAAANLLAGPMARGEDLDPLLDRVERRRRLAVRTIQAFQNGAQQRIIRPLLAGNGPVKPPWIAFVLDRIPLLRRLPAAFLGFGIRPEHVRSPAAARRGTG